MFINGEGHPQKSGLMTSLTHKDLLNIEAGLTKESGLTGEIPCMIPEEQV